MKNVSLSKALTINCFFFSSDSTNQRTATECNKRVLVEMKKGKNNTRKEKRGEKKSIRRILKHLSVGVGGSFASIAQQICLFDNQLRCVCVGNSLHFPVDNRILTNTHPLTND